MPIDTQGRIKPEIVVNELGQPVRCYTWEEMQRRMELRKPFTKDVDLNGKNLIIKHTWGIGDILYSTPAIFGLKKKFPNCKIRYICTCPDILENNPYVDQVIHWADYDTTSKVQDEI